MLKYTAILALLVAAAASAFSPVAIIALKKDVVGTFEVSPLGIVDPAYRCGGVGTPIQLRISGCEGKCRFTPGQIYDCEKDFMPSSAAVSLTLKVEICMNGGLCMQILQTVLPNSSVQPGFIYTAKYSIVPNDILSGQTVEFRGYISHTTIDRLEICIFAEIDIL